MREAYEYCETVVRERDRERFLSALYARAEKRPQLMALYAFDLEMAHIADAVREPLAGEIRFQWWREILAGERAEEAKANPVAAALLDTVHRSEVSTKRLLDAIDARQFDLSRDVMESREQLELYLDATVSAIVGVGSHVLDKSWPASQAALHAGRAIGFARVLRSFALDVSKGRLFVPLDLLAERGVHTASVMAGENVEGLRDTLADVAAAAGQHFTSLKAIDIPPAVLPAFLPAASVMLVVKQTGKLRDPFTDSSAPSRLLSQWRIWRAARTAKFS